GVKINDKGIDAGNKKITNVASGDIADGSTDAVTGEKVKSYIDSKQFLTNANLAEKVTESLKTNIKSNDLDVATTTGSNDVNINLKAGSVKTDKIANGAVTKEKIAAGAITADKIANNTITKEKMDSTLVKNIENASKLADGNITFGADSGTAKAAKFGDKINIKGGNNIKTSINGNDISVALSDTLTDIKSLAFTSGVKINDKGIDAGNKKITNLADGTENGDAVNYKQLQDVKALIGGGVSAHDFEELKKQVNKINEEGTKGFHINDMKNADDSKAEGANSIAVGAKASTTTAAADAVAIGSGAKAEVDSGVAIGKDSVAKTAAANANDVYLKDEAGVKETVKGNLGALSVGNDTNTRQIVNVAAGTNDTDAANIAQLKAVQNMIQNSSASWVAVNQTGGAAPSATGENSVAVGHNSKATGKNSVAIGAGSDDGGEENVVSVGSSGNERRITNVAEAKNETDAVNLAQLKKSLQNLQAQNLSGVYEAIDELRDDSRAGVSSALAIGNLMQSTIPGKGLISLGAGYYKGQSATALGISKMSDNGRWVFKGAVSYDSQRNVGAAASIGFHW
ncbi:YadA-like family protein, partial [uncultured Campylobacter sp.]|uniref:YadA family autotransporter adhesin n=1 Tax=uncultured Campylobacter sp. TaxID=218934 RepID=UPI00261A77D7